VGRSGPAARVNTASVARVKDVGDQSHQRDWKDGIDDDPEAVVQTLAQGHVSRSKRVLGKVGFLSKEYRGGHVLRATMTAMLPQW